MNIEQFLFVKKNYVIKNRELDKTIKQIVDIIRSKKKITFTKKPYKSIKPTNLKILKNEEQFKCVLIGLLNKLAFNNYDKLKSEILNICETNQCYDYFINCIFDIAVKQHTYSTLYVNLLNEIINKYDKTQDFINTKCLEFKSITKNDNSKDSKDLEYDEFCENNKKKNIKIGYSQFIGQLFLNKFISYDIVMDTLKMFINELIEETLVKESIEDYIICIEKLFTTIFNLIKKDDLDYIKNVISSFIKKDTIPKRLKFKLMDLIDKIK